jgi:retron-type reverse transcriptase
MSLQEQLTEWDNITLAYAGASRGKRGRRATAQFEFKLGDNLIELQNELSAKTFQSGGYHNFLIHEPKQRLISAAPFCDRVVHHALCNVMVPLLEKRFIQNSYANRVGKGTHRAISECQRLARRYKYFLQSDVVQFFPSIDHAILRAELQNALPDDSLFWLIDKILASGAGVLAGEYDMVYFGSDDLFAVNRPRGLPIGNLTSQWWANSYLNPFDHFVHRELRGKAYLRYVDDFVLFANDKQTLWHWREAVIHRLQKLRLTLHEERAVPRPVTDGVRFLGFVIYPDHRLLKSAKNRSFQHKMKHLVKAASQPIIKASLQGWINHVRYGDTWGLRETVLEKFDLLAEA